MKRAFLLISLAMATICMAMALAPQVQAQQADQDQTPTSHQPEAATKQQNEGQIPASGEATTHEAKTFSGRIMKENDELVLKDPVTKVSHKLDDAAKAKQYLGKQVKVTGKLDMDTNTIRIENISQP